MVNTHFSTVSEGRTVEKFGRVVRIAGPVVAAVGLSGARLYDVVHVGRMGLIGEVIRLSADRTTIQVYENTAGLKVGEPVTNTHAPLVATLGPGLLGSVYDGLQRPLTGEAGEFLERGMAVAPLPSDREWNFTPFVEVGQTVVPGQVLGRMPEGKIIEHRLLVPPGIQGKVTMVREGTATIKDVVVIIENGETEHRLTLTQQWPVRYPRPFVRRREPVNPLVTGTRIVDTFFPLAKGGSVVIPGGFGTGKTVVEQTIARWADADVVVYIGCGERGNEMAEALAEFPELDDPRHGTSIMERTVLIANTSNMPVAAREASIYTGVTIAEYYRDMGYDVVLLADSTSRWAEALREISGRLEEMPGEEGYPAYLAARLSEFYERAGRVVYLGSADNDSVAESGSVSIIGAVSPPGGDFSEPVTQNTLRVVGTFWALDYDLSRRRHFPAINWNRSYTLYNLDDWFRQEIGEEWNALTLKAMALLQEEETLQEIVQLVGPDALAEAQQEILAVARMLREDFLQQSAFHEVDRFCPLPKAYWMLKVILAFHEGAEAAVETGTQIEEIMELPITADIARMKNLPVADAVEKLQSLHSAVRDAFNEWEKV